MSKILKKDSAIAWEAVEYLKSKDTIENIPVYCLGNLLQLNKGESYQDYKLKNLMRNKGLVFRKRIINDKNEEEGKIIFVECVKKYYNLPSNCTSCNDITSDFLKIGDSYSVENCIECHRKCLDLFNKKELMKK